MKKLFISLMLVLFVAPVFAENANVLPQGRFRARIKPIIAFDFTQKYGNTGAEESLVSNFERELDVATAAKINEGISNIMKGLAPGHAAINSLGNFDPAMNAQTRVYGTALEYGLTKNLTLGMIVPIIDAKTSFKLGFNKNNTAKNHTHPGISQTDFAQGAKDTATKAGYNVVDDWREQGFGDIELGIKHRIINSSLWNLAYKAGVRLPTGRVDDPDILTDIGFGDGQMDWGTTLLVDYKGVASTLFNAMAKVTVQMADHEVKRVPDAGDIFTTNKENLFRNLGDRLDLAFYSEYSFLSNYNVNATYSFYAKQKDNYVSALGFNTGDLEENTGQVKHTADVGLGFTTIPWFKKGSFAIPMDVAVNAQLPLAGRNVAKATSVNLEYKLYF